MNCSTHQDAVASAICIYCGRALCSSCCVKSSSNRVVCSSECASALGSAEDAIKSIRGKTTASARSCGYFLLAAGIAFAGFAFVFLRDSRFWQLATLLFTFAVVFVVSGIALLRIAKRKAAQENAA
jgi:hypothetical protein